MQFFVVYIAEAHALDSRSPIVARGDHPLIEEPVTDAERMEVAGKCMTAMEIKQIPALVDRIDDRVNAAYAAWPDRLYLVSRDGKLRYGSGRGPFGFLPAELEMAICAELGREPPAGLEQELKSQKERWQRLGGGAGRPRSSRGEGSSEEGGS